MEIDTATLKECRLGPIVDFYTKTKRVPPSISRSANQLYDTWYRLVTGRSASLRQKPVRDIDVDDEPLAERGERARTNKRFNAEKATEENKGRKGATLPRTTVSVAVVCDHSGFRIATVPGYLLPVLTSSKRATLWHLFPRRSTTPRISNMSLDCSKTTASLTSSSLPRGVLLGRLS